MPSAFRCRVAALGGLIAAAIVFPGRANAETGRDAWLRYAPLPDVIAGQYRDVVPAAMVVLGDEGPVRSAGDEVLRGVRGMLGRTLRLEAQIPREPAIVLGTRARCRETSPALSLDGPLGADAYHLRFVHANGTSYLVVTSDSDSGVLYGAFALLRRIGLGQPLANLDERQAPAAPIRWVNQWDNLDGTIERGYGGRSIFWEGGRSRADLSRVGEYGRLLASIGINTVSINNVNANPLVLSPDLIPHVARIADALRPWGVHVAIAIDFGSPKTLGGLSTYDPLDASVAAWWRARMDDLYRVVPDLAGVVLKADSEGRVGPSQYGRTHADAANVVARALAPHGGVILYRGFVYDHHMDWQNPKNDRARAAYDNFHDLDGTFDDNVVIQIKHGPIDFQVREPVSPLFGALEHTNVAIELQITQEYMGQARHLVFLVPMWKEALDFDLHAASDPTPLRAIVSGKTFHRPTGGFVGVANVGLDDNWSGHQLSQANLYGFGRLAWNPTLTSTAIAEEWTRLTFSSDPAVVQAISGLQLGSWRTYENYTGPLGLQTLTDIVGNHYGVAVEASERNGWGQWHRADEKGVGMDRTVVTGTGYVGQYRPAVRRLYESPSTTPDDVLLFMHHVPYTYVLHDGTTVVQHIYDSHYAGAEAVAEYVRTWKMLRGRIDDERYRQVLDQLTYQEGQAVVWRDAVSMWFFRTSGIADSRGRVGNYPGRLEAETARLDGYVVKPVTPWETASGGKAVECTAGVCRATFTYAGAAGWRDLIVQYFDTNNGASRFRVRIGSQVVAEWTADDHLPTRKLDGSSSSRRVIPGVALRPGDAITIEGTPDAAETAALDYLEVR
ncbi:MAG TPA: alpha-glucuronidase family glycosyl hydrolase [Vicinamibacterales bacterium]|jgi:alpha-glucuronidase